MSQWKRRAALAHAALIDLLHAPLRRRRPDPYDAVFAEFIAMVRAMPAPTVVELGSRNVTGVTRRGLFRDAGRYVGCDVHAGEGVDLVIDVHRLSAAFSPGSVDAVFSISVFEHLAYPWKVVLEMNRILKPGGLAFIGTHPAWPPHELPWDFWRFPEAGLAHLLAPPVGFELIRVQEGAPAKVYSLREDRATRGVRDFHVNLGVAVLARKTHDYDPDRFRWDVDVAEAVVGEYPRPA
jgi:SAM-dependent methyltransferase